MAIESHIHTRNIESSPWSINEQLDEAILSRLADISENNQASAEVQLTLQREARNEVRISGQIKAEITLICQRCLQTYVCQIDVELDEIFAEQNAIIDHKYSNDTATSEQETESDYFDKEGRFSLLYYIEDEILLAVPTFPAHPNEKHCDTEMVARLKEKANAKEQSENPFAQLKNLKNLK